MDKPTVFFSHSSKDREMILPIKNRLEEITAGVLSIFMSSDGQSIPFGRNWISKIEEGLASARIMFIFVTPTSLSSEWIYFEAGYAYSKGINVIPVGIGVNIGSLKAPLNLLQGFDVISEDSLNNMVSIINKQFDLRFPEGFKAEDYRAVLGASKGAETCFPFSKYFAECSCTLYSQYRGDNNTVVRYDIDTWFKSIKDYLDEKGIKYAHANGRLITCGVIVSLHGTEKEPEGDWVYQDHWIEFKLSLLNMREAYGMMLEFLGLFQTREYTGFNLTLQEGCAAVYKMEDLSTIVSGEEKFAYVQNNTRVFHYGERMYWWVKEPDSRLHKKSENVGFSVKRGEVPFSEVCELFCLLEGKGVIFEE